MDQLLGKPFVDFSQQYAWLMLFKDGNRIDLTLVSEKESIRHIMSDKLTVVLLDKDHRFPTLPEPSDEDYHVKRPSQVEFSACTNEFWWCLNNVGKGIARDEIPYALAMYNEVVHPMLTRMADWWIGTNTEFTVNPGKYGKFYKHFLPAERYAQMLRTYCDSNPEHIWAAVFTACELFAQLSDEVAQRLALQRDLSEEQAMVRYLYRLRGRIKHE
jgi:aminoglycoside 6-adenylyltransferase